MSARLPLEGVRIVDMTLAWVGPFGTQLLADWGAEVIRVEPIGIFQYGTRATGIKPADRGLYDWASSYPDEIPGERHWNRNAVFQIHGRNKLSMTSNLPKPDIMDTYLQLVSISDVVIENNVPQTYDKIGASYDQLRQVRPDIIMVRVPAYGLTGPYARYRALGPQMESAAGHTWIRGYRDGPLADAGSSYLGDAVGGVTEAFAVLMALCHRKRTGQGQLVEVATTEAILSYVPESTLDWQVNGRIQSALTNAHASRAPQGCYKCRGEDNWLVISVGSDEEWVALKKTMEDPTWARDARFDTVLGRYRCQEEIDDHLEEWTADKDHVELMGLLQGEGVPAGAVHDQQELYEDPQMVARGYFEQLEQPSTGRHAYTGMMWKMTETPNGIRLPAPMLGEHNEYVFKELLGVTEAEYKSLEEKGHVGMDYPAHLYD